MNSTPLFSVVIPTYHRNDLLAKCLDCLAPGVQVLPAEQYEVIVTDDGSESTAQEMIRDRYPWVKWVSGPRKGPAANRNNGAKYAKGDWLAFTDDDCFPDPNWLRAFAEATNGSALALEGAIYPLGEPNQDLAECPVNLTGGYFWSANIAVERSLFEKIGEFDPNYLLAAHEDQDLKLRLSSLTTIFFVCDARVDHPVRLIPLGEAITSIPRRCDAWAYHVSKHRTALGFSNDLSIILDTYRFYFLDILRYSYRLRFKTVAVRLAFLICGIPLIGLYLRRYRHYLDLENPYASRAS